MAGGNEVQPRIAFEHPRGGVLGQGRIEIDDTFFTQFHYRVGKHRLAHRRRFKYGIIINRFFRRAVFYAKNLGAKLIWRP